MKNIKKVMLFIFASIFAGSSFAKSNINDLSTTLTIKNMTQQTITIQSELVNGFIGNPNIQINGVANQTPSITIPAQNTGNFVISDNGMNDVITGGVSLCVQGTQACGNFSMWAGGDGKNHTIWIDAPINSTSDNKYIVGAYEIDESDAVLNVYPAVMHQ